MAGISGERDLQLVRSGLARWLEARLDDVASVELGPFETSAEGGFSSQSLIFDAILHDVRGSRRTRRLVAKLPPAGEGLFRDYDFEMQFLVQDAMARHGVPVPRQVGYELDPGYVGCAFLVMDFVPGLVPSNQPMYNVSGWLLERQPSEQAAAHAHALAAMAQVHRVDVSDPDVARIGAMTRVGIEAEFAWYTDYLDWATDGDAPPEVRHVRAWCRERLPSLEKVDNVVCWGDARLGNVLYSDDLRVAALLDWEMATICPPELDLGWYSAFRSQIRARTGVSADSELPGFPDRNATLDSMASLLGRPLVDIDWYEAFAMLRLSAMSLATKRLVRRLGITDHFIFGFKPVEDWVLELIDA